MASITDDKETSRNLASAKMDVTELFALLESKESNIVDDVKTLIHENLKSSRDSWLLSALVDYYMTTKSNRALDILIGIRQPHDKHLFDKMADSLKHEAREEALDLLGHIVRRQPSWVHKIANHKVFSILLNLLKTDISAQNLMSGVLVVITLLPIIPSLVGPHLPDMFDIFSRLCAWSTQKPGNVPEVYFLHLRVPLYVLFQLLYTMYPCNFLAYLRLHYGGREHSLENQSIFSETIKPMLERVRLHPLLVTASKETELQVNRWKNLEPHDIIVQCGILSLDGGESMNETNSLTGVNSNKNNSSTCRTGNITVAIEPGSILYEISENLSISVNPTPLVISDMSPSGVNEETEASSSVNEDVTSSSQVGPSEDDVVEAETQRDETDGVKEDLESSGKGLINDVVQAEEAIEQSGGLEQPKVETKLWSKECQFQSTTNTLTTSVSVTLSHEFGELTSSLEEEANNSMASLPVKELDQCGSTTESGASNVLIERLVHGINRLRFFSHCGHPPEIPIEWIKKTSLLSKSYSWPNLATLNKTSVPPSSSVNVGVRLSSSPDDLPTIEICSPVQSTPKKQQVLPNVKTSQSVKISSHDSPSVVTSPTLKTTPTASKPAETIIPAIPKPDTIKFSMLSPSEVLDRHLQLGCEIYMKELKTMSLTNNMKDTDWTHFGGPPPVDELNILRGQISLLHMQVLFERYRREIHAERNRRLLGKAKKSRTLEEQNAAMREQMYLQEEEIRNLNRMLTDKETKLQQLKVEIMQKNLSDLLRQRTRENECLNYTNKELQHSLDMQKHEIKKLEKILDDERGRLSKLELDLSDYHKIAERCSQLESEVKKLVNQQAVLHELHNRYVDKQSCSTRPPDLEFEFQELKKAAKEEVTELKMTIRTQNNTIDSLRTKVECLEEQLSSKDSILEEQKQLLESVKSFNKDKIEVLEEQVKSLQRACQTQEQRILVLNHKLNIQDSAARPVPNMPNADDATLSYPVNWHPAQSELSYGISLKDEEDGKKMEGAIGGLDRS